MKLVYYELQKVLGKKTFYLILILCFLLNLGVFCFSQQSSEYSSFAFSDFPQIVSEYSNLSIDKAEKKLGLEMKSYEILAQMNAVGDAEDTEEMDALLSELSEMKEQFPAAYSHAENMSIDGEDTRQSFVYPLQKQVEYIKSYPSFVKEMRARADAQSNFSIFSNRDDFSYRNLYKTAEDYEHLSDVRLSVGNDLPITAVNDYTVTNYFLIAIIFLTCVYLFVQEKDKGLYALIRSSKNGRCKTIIAKLIALFIVTFTVSVLFSLSIYAVSSLMYGNFDIGRSIQSVSAFRNCVFKLNIGQFCLLTVLGKSLGMIITAAVFSLIFVVFSGSSAIYAGSIIILLIEFLLTNWFSFGTAYDYLKFINLFYILDSNHILGNYFNLNIFSSPISVYHVDMAVFSVIFVVCCLMAIIIFTIKGQGKRAGIFSALTETLKTKYFKIRGTTNILSGEAYKYLITNKMALFFILVIVFGVISSFGNVKYPYADVSDADYREYMQYLSGEITDNKKEYIAQQQIYFSSLNNRIEEYANDSTISESTKSVAINTINKILETKGKAFSRIEEQYDRLSEMQEKGEEAAFIDENLYTNLISNSSGEWKNIILLILMLIISIPFLLTIEYKKAMITLLRSTQYGKAKLYIRKLLLALVTLCVSFTAVYLPYYVRFTATYGFADLDTSIACLATYKNVGSPLSVFQAVLITTVCYFAVALVVTAGIILISAFIKSHLLSVIISTIVFVIPCLVIYPFETLRAGTMFMGDYHLISATIMLGCFIIAVGCTAQSAAKFTGGCLKTQRNSKLLLRKH